jgi:N-methylhydantoinase A/oxoprolinase/acetone carboxylase beta subunit
MALLLGIDTGGTYTDAVLFDETEGVVKAAKSLTTKYDLTVGIGDAVRQVLRGVGKRDVIELVSLSTTLATNAIVEGQGSRTCLILIGYPPDALDHVDLRGALGEDPVVQIAGGHTILGDEQEPLDLEAARQAVERYADRVSAFAVSGYFGVRNPAHELEVRQLVRERTGLPVTCGHELTSHLHAPRRALTVTLNARLIPFLRQLILSVQRILTDEEIRAPLMVVKGDGSLVNAETALERPVETILSGPAASVVGARFLSGDGDMIVVDMGGTTTDIAMLRDGWPVLNDEGAVIGGWHTMVKAVAVRTSGLGGDSEIRLDAAEPGRLVVGPRRVVPLSLLASQYPDTLAELARQGRRKHLGKYAGRFALRQRPLPEGGAGLSETESALWQALAEGPVSLERLLTEAAGPSFRRRALDRLVEMGLVVYSGLTPSDTAHVLGLQADWSQEAALVGAELWLRSAALNGWPFEGDAAAFCDRVRRQVQLQIGRETIGLALLQGDGLDLDAHVPLRRMFVDQPLLGSNGLGQTVDVRLTLNRPIVAIGAPVPTYFPEVAERLHTRLTIPEHAGVANAVGAVVGSIKQSVRLQVKMLEEEHFRAYLGAEMRDFEDREEAVACAMDAARQLAEANARDAGAESVRVTVEREDSVISVRGLEVYLGTQVVATAVGRPRLAQREEEPSAGYLTSSAL